MTLQVPPDLIAGVADAGRLLAGSRVQQEPRRLHRPAAKHDHIGRDRSLLPVRVDNANANEAPTIADTPAAFAITSARQRAVTGSQRTRHS